MNEKIMEKANAIPYDRACSASELNRYDRVLENSSKMMIQLYQAFCEACGLAEAFVMILLYLVPTDVFAVAMSAFPLLYSYILGEKSAGGGLVALISFRNFPRFVNCLFSESFQLCFFPGC